MCESHHKLQMSRVAQLGKPNSASKKSNNP